MKKPVLITLCCASLMLVTPFTSVAQENIVSSNLPEQPNDVDDDCDICPAISVISKLVDEEDNQELSEMFNELVDIYYDVQPKTLDDRIKPICVILVIMLGIILIPGVISIYISSFLYQLPFHILYYFFNPLKFYMNIFGEWISNIYFTGVELDCDWAYSPSQILTIRQEMII